MSLCTVKVLKTINLGGVARAIGDIVETDSISASNLVRKGAVEIVVETAPVAELKPVVKGKNKIK